MSVRALFRTVSIAEAMTWGLLLIGMVLKYGTRTTEVGVQIFGMLHGIVFLAYVLTTVLVWTNQRWGAGRGVLALAAAIVPFTTLPLERAYDRRGALAGGWADTAEKPSSRRGDRWISWMRAHLAATIVIGLVALAALTALALAIGPPVGN